MTESKHAPPAVGPVVSHRFEPPAPAAPAFDPAVSRRVEPPAAAAPAFEPYDVPWTEEHAYLNVIRILSISRMRNVLSSDDALDDDLYPPMDTRR